MAVLGVACTGYAFAIFYTLISRIGAARTSLVAYIAPLFAIGYGATLQDEHITVATIAGLVLILGGSWLAARRPKEPLDECPIDRAVPVHDPAPAGR